MSSGSGLLASVLIPNVSALMGPHATLNLSIRTYNTKMSPHCTFLDSSGCNKNDLPVVLGSRSLILTVTH